jgi:hypothetical protein
MGLIGMMSEPISQMGPMLVLGGPLLAARTPLELQRAARVRAASLPVALNPGAPATGR